MPTLFVIFGFRFLFYSDDHEPIHVHVIKDGHEAKYNIERHYKIFCVNVKYGIQYEFRIFLFNNFAK